MGYDKDVFDDSNYSYAMKMDIDEENSIENSKNKYKCGMEVIFIILIIFVCCLIIILIIGGILSIVLPLTLIKDDDGSYHSYDDISYSANIDDDNDIIQSPLPSPSSTPPVSAPITPSTSPKVEITIIISNSPTPSVTPRPLVIR